MSWAKRAISSGSGGLVKNGVVEINGYIGTFFDRVQAESRAEKNKIAALKKAGAFIQNTAKRSIRSRKTVSGPGKPPHSHTKNGIKKIFFAYERKSQSVIVGPVKLNAGTPGLAATLEFGGTVKLKKNTRMKIGPASKLGKYRSRRQMAMLQSRTSAGRFSDSGFVNVPRGTSIKIRPRPFMVPASEKALKDLIEKNPHFKNLIGGSDVRLP